VQAVDAAAAAVAEPRAELTTAEAEACTELTAAATLGVAEAIVLEAAREEEVAATGADEVAT
jgi:hypothetical protein